MEGPDHVSHAHDDLPVAERWLLDRCARQFVEDGTWPQDRDLVREAARADLDLDPFFFAPAPRDFRWRRDPEGVILSVRGLALTEVAAPLLRDLVRFAQLCVAIYFGDNEEPPKVGADQLRELGLDDDAIDRVYKLFTRTEYFLTAGGAGQSSVEWEFLVNDLIRKFKGVVSLDDYLRVREQIVAPEPLPPPVLTEEFTAGFPGFAPTGGGVIFSLPVQASLPATPVASEAAAEQTAKEPQGEDLVVFVSWAPHGSEEWQGSVLRFTNLLREEGFDAHVDLYYKNKSVDWSLFGTQWIRKADMVLIVASSAYAARWASEAPTGTGAGVAREAITLRRLFDEDQARFLHKVRVVLLPRVTENDIPKDITHLPRIRVRDLTAEGIDEVCRHLTGEDEYPMPDLGTRRKRGRRDGAPPTEA